MENKKTCLYDRHVALGAMITPFGGFDMPIQYSSIIEEHKAVREHCGVFDVSHMGEIVIKGRQATMFVNHIFTNDINHLAIGKVMYGMMCYDDGGTVDDTCICRMGEERYFMTVNAANIKKDISWINTNAKGYDVEIIDMSEYYGQLAIQGPESEEIVSKVLGIPCYDLHFYEVKTLEKDGEEIVISRTGYTGEDGFELYGSHKFIVSQWDKLINSGQCKPCGLGCRDTLRFEVGLPLYGNELSADDAIPRHGYNVLKNGVVVGHVTTGYRLISTNKSCAVALIDASLKLGDSVEIQIRKKTFPGTIARKKFYDKHYHQS